MFCGLFMWDYPYKNEITCVIHWMFVTWCDVVGWWWFCGWQCVGCRRWTRHRLPNWKNFALELFHRARSGSVVLCRKCQSISFESLATAGGVQTHSNRNWLPVAELRSSLMKVLEPSTEVGFNQKMCCRHDLFLWPNLNVCHMVRWRCKTLQDNARRCKIMQDNARRCKAMEGDARWCNMMQEDARWCVTSTITRKWRMLYTPSWYRAFLCHLRGFLHTKMNYHVSYTASWYRAVLSHLCGKFP